MENLFKHFSLNQNRSESEKELYFEVLKSEKTRILYLLFFLLLLLIFEIFSFTIGEAVFHFNPYTNALGTLFPKYHFGIFILTAILYEAVIYNLVTYALRKKKIIPEFVRYMNALVETSFPTVLIIIMIKASNSLLPLQLPPVFLYYVFIILSVMRLEFFLSLFSGVVGGVGYFLTARYYFSYFSGDQFYERTEGILPRAMLMIISGAIAGFVAREVYRGLVNSMEHMQEKNRAISTFGQYVSPSVAERLLDKHASMAEAKHVTILFLDIRDFTSFSEKRNPEEVFNYLNNIFGEMIHIINEHNGIINKFLGDGFMAVFGAPLSYENDMANAVNAALKIHERVDEMNKSAKIPATRLGMGVHSGHVMTGTVGSEERKEYTIIGDTVNLASRVEQLNKQFASDILVTDQVYQVVQDLIGGEKQEEVLVKGRLEPVIVYKLR